MLTTVLSRHLSAGVAGALLLVACGGEEVDTSGDGDLDGGGTETELDGSVEGTDGSATGDEDGGNCGASPFAAERVVANALFVVDKSKSMSDTADGFSTDKWTALTDSLGTVLGGVSDDLAFGFDLYPTNELCAVSSDDGVSVGVSSGSDHVDLAVSTLESATVAGGTPTAQALQRALAYYTTGTGAELGGDKYVVLATDGGPNCNASLSCEASMCVRNMEGTCAVAPDNCCDPEVVGAEGANLNCLDSAEALAAVEALSDAGVTTVVVGIPGSEAFADVLDSLAVAGGLTSGETRDYFAVTADGSGAGGLSDVLERITRQLIRTCDLQLNSTPPDLNQLNVEVDGVVVPRESDNGWELDTSTDPPTVRLKGDSCTQVMEDGAESVQVTFGCPTLLI